MLVHSRSLLLYCALAGAALASWVLARRAESPPAPPVAGAAAPRPGYYMLDAVLHANAGNGRARYRIFADRLERVSREDDFRLEGVRVEYSEDSAVSWSLEAAQGVLSPDRTSLELADVRLSSTAEPGRSDARFETSALSLDTERLVARTDQRLVFQSGEDFLVATGLELDLETDAYVLEADVMTLRAALAGGAAALLSVGAQGQPGIVSGNDTLRCPQGITGSVAADKPEFECREFSISLGESTRMSGDVAWAQTQRFDRGEVRFTGNVRIEIETAELTADSGSAILDGDEIVSLTLVGDPVRITHVIEGREEVVTGEADRISYDRDSDTFEMQGEVLFASGAGESAITACLLTYKLEDMTFNMPPGCERSISLEPAATEEARAEPSAGP